jgi:hypothetical protein
MKNPRAGDALSNINVCELDNHIRVRAGHCAENVNIVAIAEKLRSRGYRVHRTILKKYLRTVNADAARGAAVDPEGNRAAFHFLPCGPNHRECHDPLPFRLFQ